MKDAIKMSEGIARLGISLTEKLHLHLFGNLTVTVPMEMVPVCEETINRINSGEDRNNMIDLPDGVWFYGEVQSTLQQVVDGHRLEFFLNDYGKN